jgi:hypothetical protein
MNLFFRNQASPLLCPVRHFLNTLAGVRQSLYSATRLQQALALFN